MRLWKAPCRGEMRARITIQANVETRSATGGDTDSWVNVATGLRAKVDEGTAREFRSGLETRAERGVVFIIDYRAGLKPSMRVKWGTRLFDMAPPIDPLGNRRFLELRCTEVVG